ncbi:MAG: proteasome activator [Egibacteraceae bacterium]
MSDEVEVVNDPEPPSDEDERNAISDPGKLMRIAVMLRGLQEEVRSAPTDEAGRERLKIVHERALGQLCQVLSSDLQEELAQLALPFDEDLPTESEIRIAQAQLVGWLEGLFQGIQAAIFQQQAMANQQLAHMRQRGLPPGMLGQPGQPGEVHQPGTGQYL